MSIQDAIFQLSRLRSGVPQFLYSDVISSLGTYNVRSEVLAYKAVNPKTTEIDFIINSPGGSPADAYRIIRTLRNNFKVVNIIVPYWAKSAATLLALGGSTIVMDEFGELGPLDTQIGKERDDSPDIERESALNDEYSVRKVEEMFQVLYEQMFFRLYEHERFHVSKVELSKQLLEGVGRFYAPLMGQINPYKLGEKSRSLDIGDNYAKRILTHFQKHHLKPDQINLVTDYLVNQCPDHGYVVDYNNITEYIPADKKFVLKAEDWGADYADTLSILTGYFMNQPPQYIGFVLEESPEEQADGKEEQKESQGPGLRADEEDAQTNGDVQALEVSEMLGIIATSNELAP